MRVNFKRWLLIVAFGFLQKFSLEAQYVHPLDINYLKSHDFSTVSAFSTKLFSQPHYSTECTYPKIFLSQPELNQKVFQLTNQHSGSKDYNHSKSSRSANLVELNLSQNLNPTPKLAPSLAELLLDFDPNDFLERKTFIPSTSHHFLKEFNTIKKPLHWEGSEELGNYNSLTSYSTFEFEHLMNQHLSPAMLYSGTNKTPETLSPNIQNDDFTTKDAQLKEQSFKIQNLFHDYPHFLPKSNSAPAFYYDIFSSSPFEPIAQVEPNDSLMEEKLHGLDHSLPRNRQRRLTTYFWEMTDFSDYASDSSNDYLILNSYDGDDLEIVIKPLSSGGVAAGTAVNESATQGVASNMPTNFDSGIWSPTSRTYMDFLKITGTTPSSITIDSTAVKYYMNWYYGDWDVAASGTANHYDLIYYSAVPEPSTYFMTGALFCLIACNRESRRSIKKIVSFFYSRHSRKENPTEVENQLS